MKLTQIKPTNGTYSINRVSDGHDLRIGVEKVKPRDYWGKTIQGSSPTYSVTINDHSKLNEYGNPERLYYSYGKTFKEVKDIIKRHVKA